MKNSYSLSHGTKSICIGTPAETRRREVQCQDVPTGRHLTGRHARELS